MRTQLLEQFELELAGVPKVLRELPFDTHLSGQPQGEQAQSLQCGEGGITSFEESIANRGHLVGFTTRGHLEARQHPADLCDSRSKCC